MLFSCCYNQYGIIGETKNSHRKLQARENVLTSFCRINLENFCYFFLSVQLKKKQKRGAKTVKSNHQAAPFIPKIKFPTKIQFFKNCHLLPFAKLR